MEKKTILLFKLFVAVFCLLPAAWIPASNSLGRANIGSSNSGFFEGHLGGAVNGVGLTGRWGGQFFGNGEADGKPGSVGGTLGGSSQDRSLSFVGAFGAYKQ